MTQPEKETNPSIIALGFLVSIFNIFASGLSLHWIWNWHIQGIAKTLPTLSYSQALGVVCLGMWLTTWRRASSEKPSMQRLINSQISEAVYLALITFIAWVAT